MKETILQFKKCKGCGQRFHWLFIYWDGLYSGSILSHQQCMECGTIYRYKTMRQGFGLIEDKKWEVEQWTENRSSGT